MPDVATKAKTSKKVVIDFPERLFRETEEAVVALQTNRSNLIRLAVETYLDQLRRTKLEQELAEGYRANASQARGIAEELSLFETDF
jgi:metal-responsive CopG/Arc/MetJ family transcriptional regulator